MDHSVHNKIVNFIWSIADDCLRDVYVRGKYRDVILPMFVLRRLDCLLEETKEKVQEEVAFQMEEFGVPDQDPDALREASGYVFYNTSELTLKDMTGNPSQLVSNFKHYLDSFSENVKEIIQKFDLYNQINKLAGADKLHDVIEKFVSPNINLSANPAKDADGRTLPALTNLGMGYVFEELIRKFNEENNEEAGEHFTPREVIKLMTHFLFLEVKDQLPPVITIYDPACGSGGMLTESQNFIKDPEGQIASKSAVHLYGKEINGETYAICKSDMMIKGNNPENIRFGSTIASNEFEGTRFDFALSNPPYGKSWSTEQKFVVEGKEILQPRFEVNLPDFKGIHSFQKATPSSSDGQLLFLMEMVDKMKTVGQNNMGARVASVHNGSSLFTGQAGSGESNIRRYIVENDFLEAIIQLPNNLFYNTGITTYIWILNNNKPDHRKGKVQLLNAQNMYQKLRKNYGDKNCELTDDHIDELTKLYHKMAGADESDITKVFDNKDFGYYKVTVERPLRKSAQFTEERVSELRFFPALRDEMKWIYQEFGDAVYGNDTLMEHRQAIIQHFEDQGENLTKKNRDKLLAQKTWDDQKKLINAAQQLMAKMGSEQTNDFNQFKDEFNKALKSLGLKLSAGDKNQILNAFSWRDENAVPVIKKVHSLAQVTSILSEILEHQEDDNGNLQDYGFWRLEGTQFTEYEPDSELRDTENVPLKEDIHQYFVDEVRPHVDDAWIALDKTLIGCEISFNKYFYQHKSLRSLEEVTGDILRLESETEGLLKKLVSLGEAK
ncbi:class I SAM-dependent DNA methyltransferase [Endozoicomonas sp. GU-1]|uniref:type I restriction-modification system subunit M n=1 Tax=Endozoicomonas sp. GU-1 TaxID=3009078 RepID=UPI0022B5DA66|nr:class I SAM-dependent DNA methyltransferase [Endozoicomonas sp. GU-1]WBA79834.1 class I SAM-dependent DNA methyltransferase [Endozoicomonas sp. GU-1]WBA87409.1 class I SAM-dependent DNA methyltransferase [Endozoicomonas sp. GU-1]